MGAFLKLHHFATKAWGNTADAARYVAELGDQTLAAIATAETAKLYGLQILAEGVNADGDNTTRFIVIEQRAPSGSRSPTAPRAAAFDAVYGATTSRGGWPRAGSRSSAQRGFNMETHQKPSAAPCSV